MRQTFDINGVRVVAEYDDQCIENVFKPLLFELARRFPASDGRMIVFLAAPPAAGKSTLAAYLAHLAEAIPGIPPVQALGMDGFHYHQEEINRRTVLRNGEKIPMARIKGAPESFDLDKLNRALITAKHGSVQFPYYDRRLHDVVENAVPITGDILLIEGNWLLLNKEKWQALPRDFSIFVDAPEEMLKPRMIDRRKHTGRTFAEAERLYAECDGPNIRLCRENHTPANIHLLLHPNGTYEILQ